MKSMSNDHSFSSTIIIHMFVKECTVNMLYFKKGGHMTYISHYLSPLGNITLASNGTQLTGLWFDGQKYFASTIQTPQEKELDIFKETKNWLDIYFSGKQPAFMPDLLIEQTPFRKRVCEILLTIPYGKTMTYGQIASIIAKEKGIGKMSAQAVGGGVGHNPISIIIPCHRVVGTNGNLTGYAGGIDKKIQLLQLENVDMNGLYTPSKSTAP